MGKSGPPHYPRLFAKRTFERRKEEITIRGGEGGSIVLFCLHLFVQFILYYNPIGLA